MTRARQATSVSRYKGIVCEFPNTIIVINSANVKHTLFSVGLEDAKLGCDDGEVSNFSSNLRGHVTE